MAEQNKMTPRELYEAAVKLRKKSIDLSTMAKQLNIHKDILTKILRHFDDQEAKDEQI